MEHTDVTNGSAGIHEMPNESSLSRHRRVSFLTYLENLVISFTPFERLMLYFFTILLVGATVSMLAALNTYITVTVPAHAGHFSEGVVGTPRFVNPLLALSDADRDATALVYSGLMRAKPDGTFIPDLAKSYRVSEDGKMYTFTLRPDATFHDGTRVTSADVLFTIQLAQNPSLKSPKRADWEGVQVSAPDDLTVVFTLPHAYAPFIENTTIGIVPKHLWQNVTPDEFPFHRLNTNPVGTGPYELVHVNNDQNGAPASFELTAFKDFALGRPYLQEITLAFYPNASALLKAYKSGDVGAVAGIDTSEIESLASSAQIARAPLPRVFAIFFNQSQAALLTDKSVRLALNAAVDKKAVIDAALGGYGQSIDGPIPPGILVSPTAKASTTDATTSARDILEKGGWTYDETAGGWTKPDPKDKKKSVLLSLSLSTADTPELKATAEAVASAWRAAGIKVDQQTFSTGDLNTTVIRPRNYEALLFGEIVGRSLDLFAFWHSSQRTDPGLNLALYANTKADTLLSEARKATDRREREKGYEDFAKLVQEDVPAVFLYAPDFIYVVPQEVHGITLGALTTPSERFLNVYEWYTNTERVWSIFANGAFINPQ